MEKTFLPGDVRQRLTDLMKDQKVTQTELARKIGCGDSVLSRFISGQTDKLSNENIIRIARVFNVSTDFLLGITNVPDRKNYAIDELGLSAEAARNLFTEKVNTAVLNRLLESPRFAELTYTLEQYFNDTIAAGFVTDPLSKLLPPTPEWFDRLNEQMLVGTPLWVTLISVSVFAPLFEEWLCRGLILRGLLKRMRPVWAMAISSLFFAFIHLNPWQALPAFILGMIFACVYYRTGSLKLTMLMHSTNNTFAALLGQNDTLREMSSYSELMSAWQYAVLVAAGIFITVLFLVILWKNTAAGQSQEGLTGDIQQP